MKKISVVTPCYNEELNVKELYTQVKTQFDKLKEKYTYEHIFIDNASTDHTVSILKEIASNDKNVKIIVNAVNAGHIKSPFYGLQQAYGDCVILMVADLQDPPELIPILLEQWECGHSIVAAIKTNSKENALMFVLRKCYYKLMKIMSETQHISNFCCYGAYDRKFIDFLRRIDDPYPYLRGIVAEWGDNIGYVNYTQPQRLHGKTKNNWYTLYDNAMLGFVSHSKIPLRLATFIGFGVAALSLLVAVIYFVYKLIYWDDFNVGQAPVVIGLFFFSSVQLFFLGIVGEYVGSIFTEVRKRPLVIEKERINFDIPSESNNE